MVAGDRFLGSFEGGLGLLDDIVGGQAARRASEVHRTAGRMEAHADERGRFDLRRQQVAAI